MYPVTYSMTLLLPHRHLMQARVSGVRPVNADQIGVYIVHLLTSEGV
jgi:hypothetical protein